MTMDTRLDVRLRFWNKVTRSTEFQVLIIVHISIEYEGSSLMWRILGALEEVSEPIRKSGSNLIGD